MKGKQGKKADTTPKAVVITQSEILRRDGFIVLPIKMSKLFAGKYCNCRHAVHCIYLFLGYQSHADRNSIYVQKCSTVPPRYNAVVGRHLLGPRYKRGAQWDPVDLFDIVIQRQMTRYPTNVPGQVAKA